MHNLTLERAKPVYLRPRRVVEVPSSLNQYICLVVNDLSSLQVFYCNVPFGSLVIPVTCLDLVAQLDVPVGRVHMAYVLKV